MNTRTICALILTAKIAGCGDLDSRSLEAGPVINNSTYSSLLFNTTASFSSSSLLRYDFATGKMTTVLSGQSGDPIILPFGKMAIHFNRTTNNQNFRRLDLQSANLNMTPQLALPAMNTGAPQDMVTFGENKALLADLGGMLIVIDLETGEQLFSVTADWDTKDGPFRPRGLFKYSTGSITKIYVQHQGLGAKWSTYNGSQQIFVLELSTTGDLQVVDLNPDKSKIQGIPLKYSNGSGFLTQTGKPLIVSRCYGSPSCLAGVERFDPTTETVTDILSLDNRGLFGGKFVQGENEQTVYALVYHDIDYKDFSVQKIDLQAKTLSTRYEFSSNSKPAGGIFFDSSTNTLLVGDGYEDGTGSLILSYGNGLVSKIEVDGSPYNGLLVPQSPTLE